MSKRKIAVFLCEYTGHMAQPWAEAGVECYCVDTQHSIRKDRKEGNLNFVWGDVRSWRPPENTEIIFAAAFTPCTHLTVAGARDFVKKGGYMYTDGINMFETARQAMAWSGAPYMLENPVGVLSSVPHIGKPDYIFEPYHYTGYCAEDNYTKKTCLWTGNGFVMPPKNQDLTLGEPDNKKIWHASPGKDRENIRSATPKGFAYAVFKANFKGL